MKVILLIAIIVSSLNVSAQVDKTKREGEPDIYSVGDDDKEMNEAMKKARASFDTFLKAFNSENEYQYGFSVKVPFSTDAGVEHIWLSNVEVKNGKYYGEVNNLPNSVKSIKLGDIIPIDRNKISDWFYIENDKLVGGFTIRVIRNRMSATERKQFDLDFGVKID